MGPAQAIKTAFAKSFQFSGRATRPEFWWFAPLPILAIWGTLALADIWPALSQETVLFAILFIAAPVLGLGLVAAGTRRLTDAGSPYSNVFKLSLLAVLAAYTISGLVAMTLSYFAGYSSEALFLYGIFAIFVCLPAAGLLLLCFAIPLARPSKARPNSAEASP
jgi:uncharacterized membrane protein YhaH (DUF805 family)